MPSLTKDEIEARRVIRIKHPDKANWVCRMLSGAAQKVFAVERIDDVQGCFIRSTADASPVMMSAYRKIAEGLAIIYTARQVAQQNGTPDVQVIGTQTGRTSASDQRLIEGGFARPRVAAPTSMHLDLPGVVSQMVNEVVKHNFGPDVVGKVFLKTAGEKPIRGTLKNIKLKKGKKR